MELFSSFHTLSIVTVVAATLSIGIPAGDLDPPAPPAPTPGPEARTPIRADDLPLTISTRGGSYYFVETIDFPATEEAAIFVSERFVTIDLNGFSLIGPGGITGGAGSIGIQGGAAAREVTTRNGTIASFGADGVRLAARGGVAEDLHVFDYGEIGINFVGENGRVANCTVQSCDDRGISVASGSLVQDSVARGNGIGIRVADTAVVKSCVAASNIQEGIYVESGGNVIDSDASNNGSDGIFMFTGGSIINCYARGNGSTGIRLSGSDALIDGCVAQGNTSSGIRANIGSTVRGCVANDNGGNGIEGVDGVLIQDCIANNNDADGIEITRNCTVLDSMARFNGSGTSAGIHATQINNRIEGNTVIGNDIGIQTPNAIGNLVVRNVASGAGQDDFGSVADSNALGPVSTGFDSSDPGPWGNFNR
jgi:parallel beta-helix repeat protein